MYFRTKRSLQIMLLLFYVLHRDEIFSAEGKEGGSPQCTDREREALLRFKDGIDIDKCSLLTSWGRQEDQQDCCQWRGVHCDNITGHVTKLDLHNPDPYSLYVYAVFSCLESKSLPPSLLDLQHLEYLDLSSNYFGPQPIPAFLGSLTNLRYLNLSNTAFDGEIPHQLGNLSNLRALDLSCLDVIDYSFLSFSDNLEWLSKLTELRKLHLSGVNLGKASDWLKVINNLSFLTEIGLSRSSLPISVSPQLPHSNTSKSLRVHRLVGNDLKSSIYAWLLNFQLNAHLEYLDLSKNNLKGIIPGEFGNISSLLYLDLSSNLFTGSIPNNWGNQQHLLHLDLRQNQLIGQIPYTLSNLKHLTYLDLSSNKLDGNIPDRFSNLCRLQFLHLNDNKLTQDLGSIVEKLSICAHKSLSDLDLSFNKFWGSVPDIISRFSSLKLLMISDNKLNGTISTGIGQLSQLEFLNLSSNSLSGMLFESHFSKLSKLYNLELSNNSALVFNVSSEWVPTFQVSFLSLSKCVLGPSFPLWLQSQRRILGLDISDAGVSDIIPHSFWKSLSSIVYKLDMSHNGLHGTLPDHSISFDGFPLIDLSLNNFEGAIPSFLGNISSLVLSHNRFTNPAHLLCPRTEVVIFTLVLSDNMFSGELPDCWMYFDELSVLHLENNKFSGKLPVSIGTLKQLKSLHLRNNSFSGDFPESLNNCSSLVSLDMGYNLLSGCIPPEIGSTLEKLGVLSLRNNFFTGTVPYSLCHLPYLQILDLSGNHIAGTIPKCVNHLAAMRNKTKFMPDVGYDFHACVSTTYPDAATVMWARKEQYFGSSLRYLKLIDFSSNQLEGEIPQEISSLSGLVSLNLSRNNFSGALTPKLSRLASLEFLDLSNNNLSGEIPPSFAVMSWLHTLDLSNNNLSGKIPLGTQLQTFTASEFSGNPELCGDPLPKKCPREQALLEDTNQLDESDHENFFPGFYISIALGIFVGLWGVSRTLLLKRPWTDAYFKFVDDIADKLHVYDSSENTGRIRRTQN